MDKRQFKNSYMEYQTNSQQRGGTSKILEENNVNIAVMTETKKKNKGSKYVGNYAMFYSGVDEKSSVERGVAIFIDKRWEQNIQEYSYESKRLMTVKLSYYRGH